MSLSLKTFTNSGLLLVLLAGLAGAQPAPAPAKPGAAAPKPGAAAAKPAAAPAKPEEKPWIEIKQPLREGDAKVTGRAKGITKVIIKVYSGWLMQTATDRTAVNTRVATMLGTGTGAATPTDASVRAAAALYCQTSEPVMTSDAVAVAPDDQTFQVTLPQRLNAGECVVAEGDRTVAEDGTDTTVRDSAKVTSVALDFGRLRAYFTVGGAISQNRSQFSEVDTFIGFTADARVLGRLIKKECLAITADTSKDASCDSKHKDSAKRCTSGADCRGLASNPQAGATPLELHRFRMQLNAFIDTRVGFRLATTGGDSGSQAVTGGTPQTAPFQRPDQLTFNANQPGFLQFALHAPISWAGMDWQSNGGLYSFFIAPIAKLGFQSMDSPLVINRRVQILGDKAETDNARYKVLSETTRRGALPFWGYGVRMGLYSYELLGSQKRERQVANDLLGYLDFTWGKSTAHRTYDYVRTYKANLTDALKQDEFVDITGQTKRRLAIEGRLKIPYLPALIGADVNVRTRAHDTEPNDFRFIVAFRIDAQKALGRIFNSEALKQ